MELDSAQNPYSVLHFARNSKGGFWGFSKKLFLSRKDSASPPFPHPLQRIGKGTNFCLSRLLFVLFAIRSSISASAYERGEAESVVVEIPGWRRNVREACYPRAGNTLLLYWILRAKASGLLNK